MNCERHGRSQSWLCLKSTIPVTQLAEKLCIFMKPDGSLVSYELLLLLCILRTLSQNNLAHTLCLYQLNSIFVYR
jgi:hypothetical protein